MKTKITILLILILPSLSLAQTKEEVLKILENPVPLLDEIMRQIPTADLNVQEEKSLTNSLQSLAYVISQEIIAAESPDWATPTPVRLAIIDKWGEILQPYTRELIKLALDKDTRYTGAGRQSRSLLDFAPPTEEFAEQVRKYVRVSDPQSTALAVSLLYEHRLLSQSDKEVMREQMSFAQDEEERFRYALTLYGLGFSDWKGYIVEKANKVLEGSPPSSEPVAIIDFYKTALSAAATLGADGYVLLSGLENRINDPVIKASGYLAHFERARDSITGKLEHEERVAKNGSGPLRP